MKPKKHKYPTELFIFRAGEQGEEYWSADEKVETHAEMGETRQVGKYVLLEVLAVTGKSVIEVNGSKARKKAK